MGTLIKIPQKSDKEREKLTLHNLQRLIEYLKVQVQPPQFDMSELIEVTDTDCGTICCALGHAYEMDNPGFRQNFTELSNFLKFREGNKVLKWALKSFPALYNIPKYNVSVDWWQIQENNAWYWVFESFWADWEQNTIEDAVWRIEQLKKHGFEFFNDKGNWDYAPRKEFKHLEV